MNHTSDLGIDPYFLGNAGRIKRQMNASVAPCIDFCAFVNPAKDFVVADGPPMTVEYRKLDDPWCVLGEYKRFLEELA